jgi:hypothetical protein
MLHATFVSPISTFDDPQVEDVVKLPVPTDIRLKLEKFLPSILTPFFIKDL